MSTENTPQTRNKIAYVPGEVMKISDRPKIVKARSGGRKSDRLDRIRALKPGESASFKVEDQNKITQFANSIQQSLERKGVLPFRTEVVIDRVNGTVYVDRPEETDASAPEAAPAA